MGRRAHCGSDRGYQQHLRDKTRPCLQCYDAHAVAMAAWRIRSRGSGPDRPLLYKLARLGVEPAEALPTFDRRRLVTELHRLGWTDVAIAAHTRMTTYTTARIRDALGLLPNRPGAMKEVA